MKEDSQRRISASTNMSSQTGDVSDSLGLGYPSNPSTPGPHARDVSLARSDAFSDLAGPHSPVFPSATPPWSPLGLPPHHQHHHVYPHVPRPSLGQRGTSFVSSASASSHAGAGSDTEGPARSIVEADEEEGVDGDEPRMEDWRDGGADGEHDAGNDTDDEGEVEYTLKDRQDAINVEHPFGLPIWKPALYKKSRSIARHADAALHAAPSSTALHHLLPSNVVWTLSFGVWLFILCGIVSAVLFITPFGGAKYGRVVWELGTYLFWPFGKYVEGWVEELDEETKSDDVAPDGLQGVRSGDISDDEDNVERHGRRGRSGTIGQGGTISSTVSSPRRPPTRTPTFDVLPDEPLRRSDRTVRPKPSESSLPVPDEHSSLLDRTPQQNRTYGSLGHRRGDRSDKARCSSSEETITCDTTPRIRSVAPHDFSKDGDSTHGFRLRALGRIMYWVAFYLVIAPVLALVAFACWGGVFSIPMAKLLWVLLRHLNNEPLSLYFRSPPDYQPVVQDLATDVEAPDVHADGPTHQQHDATAVVYPLRAGQPAPPQPRQSLVADRRKGRLRGPHPTVLLCTYRAAGLEYYKYTVDGVNVWFVNLLALVFLAIVDFFVLAPYVERHYPTGGGGVLRLVSSQAFVFVTALLSVIPLSYFIGMAVASISAQSSIGVGAVINASFGSVIEIVLYSIALTQAKGELVEGSIVGSILAGVLLMPGMSMVGGAAKRKEQRFNARSAGVTSTMLIMAVIGTLTPTLFYEIYGSFQLTCTDCDPLSRKGGGASCSTCYYEHVSPADDPFYRTTVVQLSYYCAIILVLSYLIGLWFSLKTHASQIWQNAQPTHEHGAARPLSSAQHASLAERRSIYQRLVPANLVQQVKRRPSAMGKSPLRMPLLAPAPLDLPPQTPGLKPDGSAPQSAPRQDHSQQQFDTVQLPHGLTADEFSRAFEIVASAAPALRPHAGGAPLHSASSHVREVSAPQQGKDGDAGAHGGHDAPNWSRTKSATVLLACTVLYAIIAEILVDVVDVVLDGFAIPEKLLGITLFALVPNTTEFMNAISFALNGNIALSMEIGSAYALQVCLIQIPAMLAFTAWYGIGKETMAHRAFTLVFPRWDAIAIIFSIFLLTYVYIEARSTYFRGSLLCFAYLTLLGGFGWAPSGRDTSDNPSLTPHTLIASAVLPRTLTFAGKAKALFLSLFTH
ncbi:Ca2+:H+ antiporter [Rhodotorula toruloides]|uniref:Ca2+:H+ antiporter n=1 Tax=Rhodotorula toruloides TaxID=5286 RepID=A0A511KN51_RHOTO|nr:Ca2+:H+ antiporter [Rhodotorula toruloides]